MAARNPFQTGLALFRNPDDFFEQRLKYPQLWKPSAFVFATMVAFLLTPIVQYLSLSEFVRPELIRGFILNSVAYFFTPFVYWVGLLLFWRLVVPLAGGDVSFWALLKLSGWGFVGLALTGVTWAIGYFVALQDETYSYLAENNGYRQIDEMGFEYTAFREWTSNGYNDTVFLALFAVGVVISLLSVYLWTHAVATAGNVDRRRAAVLAIVPHALFVYVMAMPFL